MLSNEFFKQVVRLGIIHCKSHVDFVDLKPRRPIARRIGGIENNARATPYRFIQKLTQPTKQPTSLAVQPSGIGTPARRGNRGDDVVSVDQ